MYIELLKNNQWKSLSISDKNLAKFPNIKGQTRINYDYKKFMELYNFIVRKKNTTRVVDVMTAGHFFKAINNDTKASFIELLTKCAKKFELYDLDEMVYDELQESLDILRDDLPCDILRHYSEINYCETFEDAVSNNHLVCLRYMNSQEMDIEGIGIDCILDDRLKLMEYVISGREISQEIFHSWITMAFITENLDFLKYLFGFYKPKKLDAYWIEKAKSIEIVKFINEINVFT